MKNIFRPLLYMATASIIALWGCNEEKTVTLSLDGYAFLLENNGGIEKDRTGRINEAGDTVTVFVPHFISVTSLVASLEMPQGASAYVGGTKQHTGETPNDFTNYVDYIITAGQGDEHPFTVNCINELFLSAWGYSEDTMRIGAGDFSKEEVFKVHNIKSGTWEYKITMGEHSHTGVATTENNTFTIPNFLSVEEWLMLNNGKDGELAISLGLSSPANGIFSETFTFALNKEQYKIKSWQDLQGMEYDLLGEYRLYNDIAFPYPGVDGFPVEGFNPVGDSLENSFQGDLDGQGHTIKNLYINRNNQDTRYVGLFGVVERRADILPIIKNLGIELAARDEKGGITGGLYAGGIAGWNEGKLINCYVTGNITSTGKSPEPGGAGGLAGINHGGGVERSYSSNGKIESATMAGGLVGENTNGGTISSSWSNHYVVITGGGGYGELSVAAGGLAGKNTEGGSIVNCYATGDVTGDESLGGLVGYHTNISTIRTCYAVGNVIEADADGSTDVGGLIGEIDGTEERRSVSDSYWNMAANPGYEGVGEGELYGIDGRSVLEFQNPVMYVGWDFSGTWGIGEAYNNGQAYLLEVGGQENTSIVKGEH